MKATPALARVLLQLMRKGGIAESRVSAAVREELAGLFDAGVLTEGRGGSGRRVVVDDAEALASVVTRWFPEGLEAVLETPTSRARAVATRRDAKAVQRGDTEPVLVRGFGDVVLRKGEEILEVGRWSSQAGYAALEVGGPQDWLCHGSVVVVVENLEPFRQVERVVPGVDLAVYASGRLSGRVLAWLASLARRGCQVKHWGDYDPVGMDEFLRVDEACGGVELVVVGDLDELFRRFGKRELLVGNEGLLGRLRRCEHDVVMKVVGLMDRFGCGVEQEVGLTLVGRPGRPE